ncbi:unnamed protein product [Toxocara canis]|uniref:Uncharacterized protein n=1 Tax=Toxocara canis TaxID=6265 RepID=A0A183V9V3_TOXCA|nr:unnamed protein product [Toxocara canis]
MFVIIAETFHPSGAPNSPLTASLANTGGTLFSRIALRLLRYGQKRLLVRGRLTTCGRLPSRAHLGLSMTGERVRKPRSATETIEDSTPPSNIPSPAPQSSAGREKIRGRKGRGKAAAGGESVRASGEHTQPGPSSSGRSRSQYNATTGLCNSIARCDVNRVFPSAGTSALHHDEGGSRSAPQLSIVPQDDNGVIVAPSSLGVANAHDDVMGVGNSSSTAGPSVNVTSSGAAHVYSAGGDTHSLDAHTAQIRNMQRSQAVHATSSFLGTVVPRVQQLLGITHSHPIEKDSRFIHASFWILWNVECAAFLDSIAGEGMSLFLVAK